MMIAYELREAYKGTVEQPDPDPDAPKGATIQVPYFTGGVINAGSLGSIDVRQELDEGDGRIIVPDTNLEAIVALDGYAPLKRVGVGDADVTLERASLDRFKVAELRGDPRLADVTGVSSATKAELVTALEELDRRQAEGDAATPLESPTSIGALVAEAEARTAPPDGDGDEPGETGEGA